MQFFIACGVSCIIHAIGSIAGIDRLYFRHIDRVQSV